MKLHYLTCRTIISITFFIPSLSPVALCHVATQDFRVFCDNQIKTVCFSHLLLVMSYIN